jgi:hypothetical protein
MQKQQRWTTHDLLWAFRQGRSKWVIVLAIFTSTSFLVYFHVWVAKTKLATPLITRTIPILIAVFDLTFTTLVWVLVFLRASASFLRDRAGGVSGASFLREGANAGSGTSVRRDQTYASSGIRGYPMACTSGHNFLFFRESIINRTRFFSFTSFLRDRAGGVSGASFLREGANAGSGTSVRRDQTCHIFLFFREWIIKRTRFFITI